MDKNLKTLTGDAVQIAADYLLLKNGRFTTLEVKNILRDCGYFAKQENVSEEVESYYNCEILLDLNGSIAELKRSLVNDGGKNWFYEYYLSPVLDDEETVAQPTASLSHREYIKKWIHVSSEQLASDLGISKASVRAYKANINR